MLDLIFNERLKLTKSCPFENISLKFLNTDYKVSKNEDSVTLVPQFNYHHPSSLVRVIFAKQIHMKKSSNELILEILPHNLYIVLCYVLVMIMGYRESLNMFPEVQVGSDVIIASFLLFTIFLFANLVFLKKSILREVSKG